MEKYERYTLEINRRDVYKRERVKRWIQEIVLREGKEKMKVLNKITVNETSREEKTKSNLKYTRKAGIYIQAKKGEMTVGEREILRYFVEIAWNN